MRAQRHSVARRREAGFTVVEFLIYFVIALVIMAAIYQVLIGQNRLYMKQRELEDVRGSLRSAGNLLTFEFRQASASGDLYNLTSDSFVVRSLQGTGIVCGKHTTQTRLGLWGTSGDISAAAGDSAMIFAVGGTGGWFVGSIAQQWPDPAAAGVSSCAWGGGTEPDFVVDIAGVRTVPEVVTGEITIVSLGAVAENAGWVTFVASHPSLDCAEFDSRAVLDVDADGWTYSGTMSDCSLNVYIPNGSDLLDIDIAIAQAGYAQLSQDISGNVRWDLDNPSLASVIEVVEVGAPFRAFRRVQYGSYQEDGRWWLGRKVGSAASYQRMMGPLLAPTDSGLVFTYYSAGGDKTTNPFLVRYVDIVIRGESLGKVRRAGGQAPAPQEDALTFRVSLRG